LNFKRKVRGRGVDSFMKKPSWIYVIRNPAKPGKIKIGHATIDPEMVARELDGDVVLLNNVVEYSLLTNNARDITQLVHKKLRREAVGDEWFKCSYEHALIAIRDEYTRKHKPTRQVPLSDIFTKLEQHMADKLPPILQVAKEILQGAGLKGMHVKDIADAAVAQNKNMGLAADVFCKKVASALTNNLKLKNDSPTFARVNWDKDSPKNKRGKPKLGWYRLKVGKTPTPVPPTPLTPPPTGYMGKGGEYAVMSELLFWGFNASIMTVDEGIDIVASNESGKFFHIQVKTATRQESGRYSFTIGQTAFRKFHGSNVFYVFVLREMLKNEYIIIPSAYIQFLIGTREIRDSQTLSLSITSDEKKTKYFLNGTDITPCYGNFDQIR
jgi:hypothetical protein